MRRAVIASLFLVAVAASAADSIPNAVTAAINDPLRKGDVGFDARRKPAAILSFSTVKAGDKVLDLIPGNGYFSRLFSRVVGSKGHVYSIWPDPYAKQAVPNVDALTAQSKTKDWENISVVVQDARALSAPEPLDVVFTSDNYHDYPDKFMGNIDPSVFDAAVFKALKPGGVFVVIDHRAKKGRGMQDTETLHRIDPDTVKAQAIAAGFVLEAESDMLRNPKDPLNIPIFDKSIRHATDQFALRFRKPRS